MALKHTMYLETSQTQLDMYPRILREPQSQILQKPEAELPFFVGGVQDSGLTAIPKPNVLLDTVGI